MKRNIIKLPFLLGIMAGIMILFCVCAQASEPLDVDKDVSPKSLTGPASVRVSINIINVNDGSTPISVTLHDPNDQVCTNFGSGGTANLASGQSSSFTGTWNVTDSQLEAGKIIYTARYTMTDENGTPLRTSLPIALNITHNQVKPQLYMERNISPGSMVQEGQDVTITYLIKNVGTVDVYDITFTDPEIISTPVVHSQVLAVGETAQVSYSFKAAGESVQTHADVVFTYDVNGSPVSSGKLKAGEATQIEVIVADLLVQLTGQQIVNPGDKVDLTYVITNKSDLSYEQLRITDQQLGDIDSNLSLGAGKVLNGTRSITVAQTSTYRLTVTGVDSTGKEIIYQSNELTIQTTDAIQDTVSIGGVPVVLAVVIESDRDVFYEEPSEIIFKVKVTNQSDVAAENVTIKAANTTVRTIDRLEPQESIEFTKAFSASVSGRFRFSATVKGSNDENLEYFSNEIPVSFVQIVTPVPPTPSPAPTEEPTPQPSDLLAEPTAPFGGEEESLGLGSILLYVLTGLLVLIVVVVIVLASIDRRRGGGPSSKRTPSAKVIDSIERVPHRDYTRPAAAKKNKPEGRQSDASPAKEDEPDAEYSDLDNLDEYTYTPLQPSQTTTAPKPRANYAPDPDTPADTARMFRRPSTPPAQAVDADDDGELYNARPSVIEDPIPVPDGVKPRRARLFTGDDQEPGDVPPQHAAYAPKPAADDLITQEPAAPQAEAPFSASVPPLTPPPLSDTVGLNTDSVTSSADLEEDATPEKLSDEDAAMLAGSTGKYHLSRKTGSVSAPRMTRNSPLSEQAEDPEAFARRQRAARSQKTDLSSFYDDEDDEDTDVPPRGR